MSGNPGYAIKKRKKPVLKQKKLAEGNEVVKSNPSKRHRDRLNGELDHLTDLLPFSEEVRSRLDKLSVLRLSVGYLRVKSYFNASVKRRSGALMIPKGRNGNNMDDARISEGDLLLQALNGFVMVVTMDGLVFYVSPTVQDYLGFHESDVVQQSVFDLIHTEDRSTFIQQLHFALNPPADGADGDVLKSPGKAVLYSPEQLPPENSSFLERNFACRFRCLLDNSSGFLALKFQGRLKYLHGQGGPRDNGTRDKPQLALFAIATPVQPPSIVEIRAKMLLFQTKHKLDFTPTGIDSRGKVILGYSETELCMKGSGYQFIHAADMMYCADQHLRMIKTGESGMTVFRLLTKSGGWVWVKSNAKLIYKGGRPEFIIVYQRALVNAEGEEYLRQRRLQLPFSYTTGEAILYDTGPTVDISQFQFNKMFYSGDAPNDVAPGSLLDCFLKQDEAAYTQMVDSPSPEDQLFNNSRALLSIPSDSWQDDVEAAPTGGPVVVKEEGKQSVITVINNLEQLVQNNDLGSVLQNLDLTEPELMEWESALKRLSQEERRQDAVGFDLDRIITNDVFDYMDSVLFKEKAGNALNSSCILAATNHQQGTGPAAPQLFQTPSPRCTYPPLNDVYSHQQGAMNGSLKESAQVFGGPQKLSHYPLIPRAAADLQLPQHLQLQDIFSPSIDLPLITAPDDDLLGIFPSCGKTHQISGRAPSSPPLLCPQNHFAANGPLLRMNPPDDVVPSIVDMLPPLIPCNDLLSSNVPLPFAPTCLQSGPPLETHDQPVEPRPQNQQQRLPHAGVVQNGHELTPARHPTGGQTFQHAGLWPRSVTGTTPHQHGGLAHGQAPSHSSCLFQQQFSHSPAGGDVLALSGSSGLRGADMSLDQSPPQAFCYFQWGHGEPVVGSSSAGQENAIISPLSAPSGVPVPEHAFSSQNYRQKRVNAPPCGLEGFSQRENY